MKEDEEGQTDNELFRTLPYGTVSYHPGPVRYVYCVRSIRMTSVFKREDIGASAIQSPITVEICTVQQISEGRKASVNYSESCESVNI